MDPDEGRNAEVAREIVIDSNWLPPTLNGKVRYQKPPLFYWLEALSFKFWGMNEFGARFIPAFSAFLTVICVWFIAKVLWEERIGIYSAFVLSSMFIFFIFSKIVIFDMLLTFFITCSFLFFTIYLANSKFYFIFLSGLFSSFAFLTKGPVGIIMPLMGILPVIIYKRLNVFKFLILFLSSFVLIVIPIFAFLEIKAPGYCYNFFWKENVLRYLTPIFKRDKPWWFFIAVLILGMVPWSFFVKRILKTIIFLWIEEKDKFYMLVGWAIFPILFFSFSKSKMPQYILPIFPAWALTIGYSLYSFDIGKHIIRKISLWVLILYSCFSIFILPIYAKKRSLCDIRYVNLDKNVPVILYKIKAYTVSFYLNKPTIMTRSLEVIKDILQRKGKVYALTKKTKLDDIKSYFQVQILYEFKNNILLLKLYPLSNNF